MIDTILDPMIWLILVAIAHAVMGIIIPTDWSKSSNKAMGGYFLLTSVTMLYAALMMEGEEQARLALVIAGPVWVWFIISIVMELEITMGKEPITMTWKENAPPLVLWGVLALSGLLSSGWV
jgi:tryptophan-rich sensory protein